MPDHTEPCGDRLCLPCAMEWSPLERSLQVIAMQRDEANMDAMVRMRRAMVDRLGGKKKKEKK